MESKGIIVFRLVCVLAVVMEVLLLFVLEVIFLAFLSLVSDPHSIVEFAVDLVTLPETSFRSRRDYQVIPVCPDR